MIFNPNFDPYAELQEARRHINIQHQTIRSLIEAHNRHDELMVELTDQHNMIVDILKSLRHQVTLLEAELRNKRS